MEQLCSLVRTRPRIASLMKGSGSVLKALSNFQEIVGGEEYFSQVCETLLSYPATFLVYPTKSMAWSGRDPLYKRNISRAVSVLTLD